MLLIEKKADDLRKEDIGADDQLCSTTPDEKKMPVLLALREVTHQANTTTKMITEDQVKGHALKNIYFIRDKVIAGGEESLLEDYIDAINSSDEEEDKRSLEEWLAFVKFYARYIKQFPELCANMAVNQPPDSSVHKESMKILSSSTSNDQFQLYLINHPEGGKEVEAVELVKETSYHCAVSTRDDLCCVGGYAKVYLLQLSSGKLLHQIKVGKVRVEQVFLSPATPTFWGGVEGVLTVWNTKTGYEEEKLEISMTSSIIWMFQVDENLLCGTGGVDCTYKRMGEITIVDIHKQTILHRWSTGSHCWCYTYSSVSSLLLSGHKGVIKGWNPTNGNLLKTFQVDNAIVMRLCSHYTSPHAIYTTDDSKLNRLDTSTSESITLNTCAGFNSVSFDHTGERILCTALDFKTILILNSTNGDVINKLQFHSHQVRHFTPVPGSDRVITNATDVTIMWPIPATGDDHVTSDEDQVVTWCGLLHGGEHYVTLNDVGLCQVWDVVTGDVINTLDVNKLQGFAFPKGDHVKGALHPDGTHVFITTPWTIYLINTTNLIVTTKFQITRELNHVYDVQVSLSGNLCTVVTSLYHTVIFDVTNDEKKITKKTTIKHDEHEIRKCDIHRSGTKIVLGGDEGVHLIYLEGDGESKILPSRKCYFVKFLYDEGSEDAILYCDFGSGTMNMMSVEGVHLSTFDSKVEASESLIHLSTDHKVMITSNLDGCLAFHDVRTGKRFYTYVDKSSRGFSAMMFHPSGDGVIAYNQNGRCYQLKRTLPDI